MKTYSEVLDDVRRMDERTEGTFLLQHVDVPDRGWLILEAYLLSEKFKRTPILYGIDDKLSNGKIAQNGTEYSTFFRRGNHAVMVAVDTSLRQYVEVYFRGKEGSGPDNIPSSYSFRPREKSKGSNADALAVFNNVMFVLDHMLQKLNVQKKDVVFVAYSDTLLRLYSKMFSKDSSVLEVLSDMGYQFDRKRGDQFFFKKVR